MNRNEALVDYPLHNGFFPVPDDIRSQVDDLREKLRPMGGICPFGGSGEQPGFVGALEDFSTFLRAVVDNFFSIQEGARDNETASETFVTRHALQDRIRYLDDLIAWIKLTWRYDPVIMAAFVPEINNPDVRELIDDVRARQADLEESRVLRANKDEEREVEESNASEEIETPQEPDQAQDVNIDCTFRSLGS